MTNADLGFGGKHEKRTNKTNGPLIMDFKPNFIKLFMLFYLIKNSPCFAFENFQHKICNFIL